LLFQKDEEMENYRAKFAGSQADRAAAVASATAALSVSNSTAGTACVFATAYGALG